MKLKFPPTFFQHNKLKEIYYKSLVVKNAEEKFNPDFLGQFPIIETVNEVSLMNLNWGSSKKTITRLLGNPRFSNKPIADEAKDILFFKQEIEAEKAIIQCHFIKDQFYYAHIDFIASLSKDNKSVPEMVREKFKIEAATTNHSVLIRDPAENKLIMEHNVYLHLDYLTGKPALLKKIYEREMKSGAPGNQLLRHAFKSL